MKTVTEIYQLYLANQTTREDAVSEIGLLLIKAVHNDECEMLAEDIFNCLRVEGRFPR